VTLNRELLGRVRDFVAAEPERFDIGTWFHTAAVWNGGEFARASALFVQADCGTTACIAGTAVVLGGLLDSVVGESDIAVVAQEALGLGAGYLFYRSSWPRAYRLYEDSSGRVGALQLISHMLDDTVILSGNGEFDMFRDEFNFWETFTAPEVLPS
jgi:hypothetical protein